MVKTNVKKILLLTVMVILLIGIANATEISKNNTDNIKTKDTTLTKTNLATSSNITLQT